jgi:23S rRNA pseudouridine1911/1915/1917 synthase
VKTVFRAIVCGPPAPPRGSGAAALARSGADRRRVVVDAEGQHSRTEYEVMSTTGGTAVVRCELATGRTHQIRVHLASRGWPVAGDLVYGAPHPDLARQALHAWRVTLPHPITRETLTLEAPIPGELQALLPAARGHTDA